MIQMNRYEEIKKTFAESHKSHTNSCWKSYRLVVMMRVGLYVSIPFDFHLFWFVSFFISNYFGLYVLFPLILVLCYGLDCLLLFI